MPMFPALSGAESAVRAIVDHASLRARMPAVIHTNILKFRANRSTILGILLTGLGAFALGSMLAPRLAAGEASWNRNVSSILCISSRKPSASPT